MYAEFDRFLFIDYVWVSSQSRGQGTGHKLIEKLKQRNKPIILEVEPVDYDDTDSEKRLHFYKREGFSHAQYIDYNRRSLATNEQTPMEILYWSPNDESEEMIYEQMKKCMRLSTRIKMKNFMVQAMNRWMKCSVTMKVGAPTISLKI